MRRDTSLWYLRKVAPVRLRLTIIWNFFQNVQILKLLNKRFIFKYALCPGNIYDVRVSFLYHRNIKYFDEQNISIRIVGILYFYWENQSNV